MISWMLQELVICVGGEVLFLGCCCLVWVCLVGVGDWFRVMGVGWLYSLGLGCGFG